MKLIKTIIIIILFNNIFSQEFGIISNNKKPYFLLSASLYKTYDDLSTEISKKTYSKIKFNYKMKSPFQFWIGWDFNDAKFSDYGLGYILNSKKWSLTIFFDKNTYKDPTEQVSDLSLYLFSKKIGWIMKFSKKNNHYIKYTNCFENNKTNQLNLTKENDFISVGSLFEIKNIILGYELSLYARDVLMFDLNNGLLNLSLGYKIN